MSKIEVNGYSTLFLFAEWVLAFFISFIFRFPILIGIGLSWIGLFVCRLYLIMNKYSGSEEERRKWRSSFLATEGWIMIVGGIAFIVRQFC